MYTKILLVHIRGEHICVHVHAICVHVFTGGALVLCVNSFALLRFLSHTTSPQYAVSDDVPVGVRRFLYRKLSGIKYYYTPKSDPEAKVSHAYAQYGMGLLPEFSDNIALEF